MFISIFVFIVYSKFLIILIINNIFMNVLSSYKRDCVINELKIILRIKINKKRSTKIFLFVQFF